MNFVRNPTNSHGNALQRRPEFKALFESLERDQIWRGAIAVDAP
jgi:hypothetical protein